MKEINANNLQQVAEGFKGVLQPNQVFDNVVDNALVVVTQGEKGYNKTLYAFPSGMRYDECSKLAKELTAIICPHISPVERMQIILRAL